MSDMDLIGARVGLSAGFCSPYVLTASMIEQKLAARITWASHLTSRITWPIFKIVNITIFQQI